MGCKIPERELHRFQLRVTGEIIPESWGLWRGSKPGTLQPLPTADLACAVPWREERVIRDGTKFWNKGRLQDHWAGGRGVEGWGGHKVW